MYHLTNGLYFGKKADGTVVIIKRETAHRKAPVVFQEEITPDCWASIMSHLSHGEDNDVRFKEAQKFHTGKPA